MNAEAAVGEITARQKLEQTKNIVIAEEVSATASHQALEQSIQDSLRDALATINASEAKLAAIVGVGVAEMAYQEARAQAEKQADEKIIQSRQQFNQIMLRLTGQLQDIDRQLWQNEEQFAVKAANIVSQSFSSAFDKLITTHQSFSQTMQKFWVDMVHGFEKMGLDIIAQDIKTEVMRLLIAAQTQAGMTAVAQTGSQTRQGLQTVEAAKFIATETAKTVTFLGHEAIRMGTFLSGFAVRISHYAIEAASFVAKEAIKTVTFIASEAERLAVFLVTHLKVMMHYAAEAAAAVFSAVAAIPIVGPFLAPVAAAGAYAAVLAFGEKGGVMENDGPLFAHKKEMILPAHISTALTGAIPSISNFNALASSNVFGEAAGAGIGTGAAAVLGGASTFNPPPALTSPGAGTTGGNTSTTSNISHNTRNQRVNVAINHNGTNLSHDDIIAAVRKGIRRGEISI